MTAKEIKEANDLAGAISMNYELISQTDAIHTPRNIRSVVGNFEKTNKIMAPLMRLCVVALGATTLSRLSRKCARRRKSHPGAVKEGRSAFVCSLPQSASRES